MSSKRKESIENPNRLTPESMRFLVDLHLIFKEHPKEINEIINRTMIGVHISPLSHYLLEHPEIIEYVKEHPELTPKPESQKNSFSFLSLRKK
jgi:hypothetical protein